ncbi:MAG: tandem-95 repeat protein, partial [Pseudomonadales bacterium]|nr:tandem-95 repeat protein [Pseudomonadales bacterium]
MRSFHKALLVGSLAFSLAPSVLNANPASPHSAAKHEFGIGQPAGLMDLPPGKLRSRIETLPAAAQKQALKWLQRFSFPPADFDFLEVDAQGGIFYRDTFTVNPIDSDQTILNEPQATAGSDTTVVASTAMTSTEVFALHSRPGATRVVFLDFDGHVIQNTGWNNGSTTPLNAQAFDLDGDPYSFSQLERDRIAETWHRIAEDYAAFDVDVTTEDPVNFGPTVGRLLFTRDVDASGIPMPAQGAGGVAYVGVFGESYYTSYSPALVYYNNLGSGYPAYMAEAASHEFGHNLALSHDGTSTAGYYTGHGSGYVSWAPIMGVGYYASVTQWSKGEYADANNTQDDLAILSSKLGYRFDDHDNAYAGATPLLVASDGSITASNPQTDPGNSQLDNKGVIDRSSDVDFFSFETAAGSININVKPAWDAYYLDNLRGANLDLRLALYDAQNMSSPVAVSDPLNETQGQIQLNVAAGMYYLSIEAVGNSVTPYSRYGSMGQYFISGSVVPVIGEPVNNPPLAGNDMVTMAEDTQVSIAVLLNDTDIDGDSLSLVSVGLAANGSAAISGGQINYAPAANFYGSDSFSYTISDGNGGTSQATVNITVGGINDAPMANGESFSLDQDTSLSMAVLANDSDIDDAASALFIASVSGASHGVLQIAADQKSVIYTPDMAYFGADSFSYTMSDAAGATASANVAMTVLATAILPFAPSAVVAV